MQGMAPCILSRLHDSRAPAAGAALPAAFAANLTVYKGRCLM